MLRAGVLIGSRTSENRAMSDGDHRIELPVRPIEGEWCVRSWRAPQAMWQAEEVSHGHRRDSCSLRLQDLRCQSHQLIQPSIG